MKNLFLSILFLVLIFGQGCVKDESSIQDCTNEFLSSANMIPFSGSEITDCTFFAKLFIYQGKQYYVLNSHCADMVFNPVDCAGNELCNTPGNGNQCTDFQEKAEFIRIVGIIE